MSRNVNQVYTDNPTTTLATGDLLYLGKSPYGIADDSAIKAEDIFASGAVNNGDLVVYSGTSGKKLTTKTLSNGQLLIGSTGAAPVGAVPTNGTNISWTTGAGSLTANLTTLGATDGQQFEARFTTLPVTITGNTTLTNAHWSKRLIFNSVTAITITLPQQSTLATVAGVWFEYENIGAGTVTFVKEGAELYQGNADCDTNGSGKIIRDSTTSWMNTGGTSVFVGVIPLFVQIAANVTYRIIRVPGSGTIINLSSICRSGTCTATFIINAATITATANAVSTTSVTQAATAANTFVVGDYIGVTISANAVCLDMDLTVEYTYRVNI